MNPHMFFRYRDTYPYLLKKHLEKAAPEKEIVVSNLGGRAYSVAHAAARRHDLVSWMQPSATIIHHGIVDCWLRGEALDQQTLPLDKFLEQVKLIVDLKAETAPDLPLIVVGILPTNARMLAKSPRQNEAIAAYNEGLRALCAGAATFFDVEAIYGAKVDKVIHEDGHHLNREGHKLYAAELFRLTAPALGLGTAASTRGRRAAALWRRAWA